MPESQNVEYKESWRDEYLKWLCGFANAQGGTMYIGVNDSGKIVGVKNIQRLMEDIPSVMSRERRLLSRILNSWNLQKMMRA